MSSALFVDTGAWYAALSPTDKWHDEAARLLKGVSKRKVSLVTSNLVVGETYTLLVVTRGHDAAWRFMDVLGLSARLEIARVEPEIEREAWAILKRFSDQDFSFVDGTSFALMRKRKLQRAFAFDRHFATAGFVRVPRDAPL